MPTSFLHAADLHLDTPFGATGRYPAHVAEVLRDASLQALGGLVDLAVERRVAFVVFAGDVYDGPDRGVRAQLRFRDGLDRLHDEGIPSFVAHGNHDPVHEGWSAVDRFPPSATFFPAGRVASVSLDSAEGPVTVHGTSYDRPQVTENLTALFSRPTGPGLHVGVLHCNVGQVTGHAPYSPCTVADLLAVGFDYWALGHVHDRRILHRDPWIVYPGNLQGHRAAVTERGPKGALVVPVGAGRIGEPELVALDTVRFAEVVVDVTGRDLDSLMDALVVGADRARADAPGRSLVVSAVITGTGPLHDHLRVPDEADDLLRELRAAEGTGAPFLWWDALAVRTSGLAALRARREGSDFVTDLVAAAATLATGDPSGADPREAWAGGLAADLVRLAGGDEALPGVDELWDEAIELAVELLTGAET